TAPRLPVRVKHHGGDVTVTVDATRPGSPNATVLLLPYLASRDVVVGRGENSGKQIKYTNIVREIIPLGAWSGAPVTFSAKLPGDEKYDGAVV
ncbi:DUF1223 domain-containing protein, partial [Escherichia coli]|nr:DUF1223 domain-containing protein [Escherichia coli]